MINLDCLNSSIAGPTLGRVDHAGGSDPFTTSCASPETPQSPVDEFFLAICSYRVIPTQVMQWEEHVAGLDVIADRSEDDPQVLTNCKLTSQSRLLSVASLLSTYGRCRTKEEFISWTHRQLTWNRVSNQI